MMGQSFMNSIWMGDLEDYMDETFIKRAFELMDETVGAVKIIRNKTSMQPLGYCFVDFPAHVNARDTMMRLNGKTIPGSNPVKRFKLNNASYGRDIPGGAEFSLFVGELTEDVDDLALFRAFSRYATCKSAKVVTDGGRSRGYGFVRFASEMDQKRALQEMQNFTGLGFKALRVSLATPKRQEDGSGAPQMGIPGAPYTAQMPATPEAMSINDSLAAAVAAAVSGNSAKQAEYFQQMYQMHYYQQPHAAYYPPTYPTDPSAAHVAFPPAAPFPVPVVAPPVNVPPPAPTGPAASPTKPAQKKSVAPTTVMETGHYWKSVEDELLNNPDVFQDMEISRWDMLNEPVETS